ncbi:MAG TPA: L,D-transpeptidase family protein [Vicinamibacterales bacterium]|nr:L,D-transpeptidase family protein [Vicinamibacterales bacterium]
MTRPLLAALIVTAALAAQACHRPVDNSIYAPALQRIVTGTPGWVDHTALGARLWTIERHFYQQRQFMPAWVNGDAPAPAMAGLVRALERSDEHGLDPLRYGLKDFAAARAQATDKAGTLRFAIDAVPPMDARMTYAYLQYAADLLGWTHNPRDVYENWRTEPQRDDLAARLDDAVSTGRVGETLDALAPTHPQYKGLQAALATERAHPDGHLDQLKMNLERWRWMPRDLGDRYVLVNVPAYQMQVIDQGHPVVAMRVIVGRADTPTPLFSDEMTYIVFSPYWNIPESIIKKETIPHMVRDPDYLERNHIEVVGTNGKTVDNPSAIDWSNDAAVEKLRFRQAPGPENALGLVKFIFPNHFNVYLHDTPNDGLFSKRDRDLSHGCIRLENPVALAQYVLRNRPEWTAERIADAMHAKSQQVVTLKHHLPVHIGYWTAWVEPDGRTVTYTADPYGIDAAHERLLRGETPQPVKASPTPAAA